MVFHAVPRRLLRQVIPDRFVVAGRRLERALRLRRLVRRMRRLDREALSRPDTLRAFRAAWGNLGYSGDVDYLHEITRRAASATGPILECGSGASTVVLALAARSPVLSLEEDEEWARSIKADLWRLGLDPGIVVHAPLVDHGSFQWYEPRALAGSRAFQFVFCDGPAHAPAWRWGLLPVLSARRISFDEIVCDDADDPRAPAILAGWAQAYGVSWTQVESQEGALAIVRSPDGRAGASAGR
jgi:hypothetical protein